MQVQPAAESSAGGSRHLSSFNSPMDGPTLEVTLDDEGLFKMPYEEDDNDDDEPNDQYDDVPPPEDSDSEEEMSKSTGKGKKAVRFRKGTPGDGEESDPAGDVEMSDLDSTTDEEAMDEEEELPVRSSYPDPSSPSSPSLTIAIRRGNADTDKVKLAGGTWMTNYDYNRLVNIATNRKEMRKLGILSAADKLKQSLPPAPPAENLFARRRVPRVSGLPQRILPLRSSKSQPKT